MKLHHWESAVHQYSVNRKRGCSVVWHLRLVLEVQGLIPARDEENFGVRTPFL